MTRLSKLLLSVLLILFIATGAQAQPDFKGVQQNIAERLSEDNVLGTAITYIYPNGRTRFISRGSLSTRRNQTIDKNTIFEIGSVSKTFTALILMKMAEEGSIALDTPVEILLPDSLNIPSYKGQKITLKHLATHTSGLPGMPANFSPADNLNPYADYSVADMYKFLDNYSLSEAPGSSFAYSNIGMGLLGHALSRKAGKSYGQLVKKYITIPLGMTDTYILVPDSKEKRFATPYNYGAPAKHWDIPTLAGAGAIRSTAADMATYMKAQLGLQVSNLETAIKKTHQIRFDTGSGLTDAIGLGWFYATDNDTILWHDGGTGGFQSFAGLNKEDRTAVVVLSNGKDKVHDIGLHLLDKRHKLKKVRATASIDSSTLDSYTGTYAHASGIKYYVSREGDQLMVQITGQPKHRVFPKSQTRFFYKVVDAEIGFTKGRLKTVSGLVLYQSGMEIKAKKMSDKIK